MGFFGSGDKSTSSADQRVGASDNAIVLQSGAFLFAPNRKAPLINETLSPSDPPNWMLIVGIIGGVVMVAIWLNSRK